MIRIRRKRRKALLRYKKLRKNVYKYFVKKESKKKVRRRIRKYKKKGYFISKNDKKRKWYTPKVFLKLDLHMILIFVGFSLTLFLPIKTENERTEIRFRRRIKWEDNFLFLHNERQKYLYNRKLLQAKQRRDKKLKLAAEKEFKQNEKRK